MNHAHAKLSLCQSTEVEKNMMQYAVKAIKGQIDDKCIIGLPSKRLFVACGM